MDNDNTGRGGFQPPPPRSDLETSLSLFKGEVCFSDPTGGCWIQCLTDGRRKVYNLLHDNFCKLYQGRYYGLTQSTPSRSLTDGLIAYQCACAHANREPVETRVARPDRANVYIHLLDKGDGIVHVSPTGWSVLPDSPIRFRELVGMTELPIPYHKDAYPPDMIAELFQSTFHLSLDSTQLLLAWALSTLSHTTPFPVLILFGAAGSHKTTLATWIKSLIDPCASPESLLPDDARDLGPSLSSSYIPLYGNVTRLSREQSAYLCTASTGGGTRKREMYTDTEALSQSFHRPVILSATENPVWESGLRSRSLLIELDTRTQHRSQSYMDEYFHSNAPGVFAGLLDVLSTVLSRLPSIQDQGLPRMTDFTRVGMAMALSFGWTEDQWLATYYRNLHGISRDAVADSPIGAALLTLVNQELDRESGGGGGSGARIGTSCRFTAENLLGRLTMITPVNMRNSIPDSAQTLGHELNKIQGDLPAHRITFSRERTHGTRFVVFTRSKMLE